MLQTKKSTVKKAVVKKASSKKSDNPVDDYKDMVNPETGKKGQMGGEGRTPPFSNPSKQLRPYKKLDPATSAKNGKKMKMGGSLKPVSSDKVGLKKLPTAVRNKMGYQKNGGMMKKAKSGTSLGMKSVKSGYDNNPGVTRADIITAAKGKAKSGASMKAGGKMKKCRGGCK